ncbi:MAG TPA: 16S rRNA (adenine(1518)-N(6)/adenine(1519)-N(6))-dimethyltransferase RsmA [Abditibacteriaceae bacterium]|jgi:16S rRNA (adenine1518-N6/adenine1519-N6)-dimethyltransferase
MADYLFDSASPGAARALLEEIGAQPNKTLGQNFLVSGAILDRIVATSGTTSDDAVLEIGPGLGALTCRLARAADRVVAVEKDGQYVDLLHRHLPLLNLHLHHGDALRVVYSDLMLPATGVRVVANLPYFISKPMLRRLLEEWRPHLKSITVLVQREVADRIVAAPATSAYGPMGIMASLWGDATRVFDVKPGSFLPPPNVMSSVVHIEVRQTPRVELKNEPLFWRIITAAFGQRRKQLGNTLRAVQTDKEALNGWLERANIDGQRRGETLSLQEFANLSELL